MRAILMVCVAVVLVQSGCTVTLASSRAGFMQTQLKRASFDLSCSEDKLDVVELEGGAYQSVMGVSGCGNKATYKYVQRVGWTAQTLQQQASQ